jgi:toluene monooxygenase system protein A
LHQHTVVERLLTGQIPEPTVPGILAYMGLTPDVMGDDAYKYSWAADYKKKQAA